MYKWPAKEKSVAQPNFGLVITTANVSYLLGRGCCMFGRWYTHMSDPYVVGAVFPLGRQWRVLTRLCGRIVTHTSAFAISTLYKYTISLHTGDQG